VQVKPEIGDKKYRLHKLFINGQDVTAGVLNGEYCVESPENRTYITAEFVEWNRYSVQYTMNRAQVGVVEGSVQVYENENATFTLDTKDGYQITSVTANGQTLTATNGKYTVEKVTEDITVEITTEKIGGEQEEQTPPAQNAGCSGSVSGTVIGLALLLSACAVVRKKEN
jgi:hypothetical protein